MKIIAELLSVNQSWSPDTNTHTNTVTFAFAGVQVTVALSPEQVREVIATSQRAAAPTGMLVALQDPAEALDDLDEPEEAAEGSDDLLDGVSLDTEFGGNFADPNTPMRVSPTLFKQPTATQQRLQAIADRREAQPNEPFARRQKEQLAMRARAQATLGRKINATEGGYPDVKPQPVVRTSAPTTQGDDDGFAQG